MRIQNTTLADIRLNYRTGQTVVVPAGQYVIRPAGDLDYLDDTAVTLALFSGGSLVLYNDDGSAYTGSALPSAPKAPAEKNPIRAGLNKANKTIKPRRRPGMIPAPRKGKSTNKQAKNKRERTRLIVTALSAGGKKEAAVAHSKRCSPQTPSAPCMAASAVM